MSSKSRNTNYDILDKMLSDSDLAQRVNDLRNLGGNHVAEGAWVTSKEEFDKLYKNVDELEKYLRS